MLPGFLFNLSMILLALWLFGNPFRSEAQQAKEESPASLRSRQRAISIAQAGALDGCYGSASNLGAEIQDVADKNAELRAQIKALEEKLKEVEKPLVLPPADSPTPAKP